MFDTTGALPGRAIALGERVAGSSLAALTDEDFDWYSLTLTSRTRISPRLTFPSSLGTGAGYQVGILDATGAPVQVVSVKASRHSGTAIPAVNLGAGTWGPGTVTLRYQWLRGGKAISGATKSSYKLTSKDKGAKIAIKVTGKKKYYATVAKTSATKKIS